VNRDTGRLGLFRDELHSPMREIWDEMVMKENPNRISESFRLSKLNGSATSANALLPKPCFICVIQ